MDLGDRRRIVTVKRYDIDLSDGNWSTVYFFNQYELEGIVEQVRVVTFFAPVLLKFIKHDMSESEEIYIHECADVMLDILARGVKAKSVVGGYQQFIAALNSDFTLQQGYSQLIPFSKLETHITPEFDAERHSFVVRKQGVRDVKAQIKFENSGEIGANVSVLIYNSGRLIAQAFDYVPEGATKIVTTDTYSIRAVRDDEIYVRAYTNRQVTIKAGDDTQLFYVLKPSVIVEGYVRGTTMLETSPVSVGFIVGYSGEGTFQGLQEIRVPYPGVFKDWYSEWDTYNSEANIKVTRTASMKYDMRIRFNSTYGNYVTVRIYKNGTQIYSKYYAFGWDLEKTISDTIDNVSLSTGDKIWMTIYPGQSGTLYNAYWEVLSKV